MKKLLFFLLALVAMSATYAQSAFTPVLRQMAPGQSVKSYPSNSNLRSNGPVNIVIDYDSADRYYSGQIAGDTVFPTNASGYLYTYAINNAYDTSYYYDINFAAVSFDTLIDASNHFAGMTYSGATVTVDSFVVLLNDSNGSGSPDTFTVSVFDATAATTSGTGLNETIVTTPLWSQSIGGTSNLFGPGTGNYVFNLTFAPNVTLPVGHVFGIRVDFKGNTADQFAIAASGSNSCGTNYESGLCSPNPAAPHNSSSFFNYGTLSGVYDWQANTPVAPAAALAPCDLLPLQNFYITSFVTVQPDTSTGISQISAGVSNFSVYPNPSNGTFTAAISLTHASDVTISIADMTGNKVYEASQTNVQNLNKSIDLSSAAAGIYFVSVKTAEGTINQRIAIK